MQKKEYTEISTSPSEDEQNWPQYLLVTIVVLLILGVIAYANNWFNPSTTYPTEPLPITPSNEGVGPQATPLPPTQTESVSPVTTPSPESIITPTSSPSPTTPPASPTTAPPSSPTPTSSTTY